MMYGADNIESTIHHNNIKIRASMHSCKKPFYAPLNCIACNSRPPSLSLPLSHIHHFVVMQGTCIASQSQKVCSGIPCSASMSDAMALCC